MRLENEHPLISSSFEDLNATICRIRAVAVPSYTGVCIDLRKLIKFVKLTRNASSSAEVN